MKRLFWIILLFIGLTACAEVKKLALIGDNKICSLLTVELSKNNNIQLLERDEIDKMLKEHKLSENKLLTPQLVKLFPHADIFTIILKKRLIVFNAKNGFRLMDANASKVQELTQLIKLAVKKVSVQNPVYVSIVSVRDIGVPRRYKPKIKVFTRVLEQELMKQSNIQMLERSHLALVNKEREITKNRYNLKASARLLTLEFEPGHEANIINVKLIIRNLANEITGIVNTHDAFNLIPQAIADLNKRALHVLNRPRTNSLNAQREAQRFFKEYQRLVKSQGSGQAGEIKKYTDARDKLFSALALAPDNKNIRFAELIYYSKMLRALPLDQKISTMCKQLKLAKNFRADFGVCSPSVFEIDILCGGVPSNYAARWTPEFQRQYSLFCREFRPLLIADIKALYYPYDLTDGINSLKELKNFTDVVIRSNWHWFYGNQREWLKQRFDDYASLYKEAAKYIATHPQESKKVNQIIRESYLTDIFYPNQHSLDLPGLAEHLEQTKELCEFIANSKLDSVKPNIFLLDAMRAAIKEKPEENFTRAIDQYLERLAAIRPKLLLPSQLSGDGSFKDCRFCDFCDKIIKQYNLPNQRLKIYQQKHAMNSEFEDLDCWITRALHTRNSVAFVHPENIISTMKKFCLLSLKDNRFGNRRGSVIEAVFHNDRKGKAVEPEKKIFFIEANSDFAIVTKPYYELLGMSGAKIPVKLCGAVQNNEEIALFFDNKHILIRQSDGSFISVPKTPAPMLIPYNQISGVLKRPIALSDSHLVFADEKGNLRIYDRARKEWALYEDFSPEPIISLLIHGDKIYALAGDEEWAVHNRRNYMFSCNLDGSGRRILFSSERSEKLNELDKLRGGLSSLTAIGDNKLAFLLTFTNEYTQIWQYDIEHDRFKRLFKALYPGTNNDAMWQGLDRALYLASCSWSERIYRFKPDAYKPEWIFCQSGRKRKFDSPSDKPVFFNGRSQLRPPWRISGNYLWCGGETSALLDLNNIKANPPLLLLPKTHYVYELGNNKMIFFGDYRYFIVHLKAKKDKSAK
jgi:hypothetical protein